MRLRRRRAAAVVDRGVAAGRRVLPGGYVQDPEVLAFVVHLTRAGYGDVRRSLALDDVMKGLGIGGGRAALALRRMTESGHVRPTSPRTLHTRYVATEDGDRYVRESMPDWRLPEGLNAG